MDTVQHTIALYGYAALLPLAVVEGPAVTVFAAFLAAQGLLDVAVVYVIAVIGDLLGDVLYYAAGRWLLQRLTDRRSAWAARLRARVSALAPRIRARAGAMLLFGKLTHSAGFAVLIAAGASHVPMRPFLGYNVLGSLLKSLVLVAVGYWFGRLYGSLQGDLQIAAVIGFVLTATALILVARRMLTVPDETGA